MLIVQDDVTFCRNFRAALDEIVAARPDVPVCLFLGREARFRPAHRMIDRAERKGDTFVPVLTSLPLPMVATVWPTAKAHEFHEWSVAHPSATSGQLSDDGKGHAWMHRTRQTVLCTIPSLVEHPDLGKPLIRPRYTAYGSRTAYRFIGDADPLDIQWR